MLAVLEQQGLLVESSETVDFSARNVLIEGDTPITEFLAYLLKPYTSVVTGTITADVVSDFDIVISCAGWLSDHRWCVVDELCQSAGVSWHRCYAESRFWVLGPMSLPGRTASYADTRARILAATPHSEELRDHWRYLDAELYLPPVPWPSAGALALVAGLVASDVIAALSGNRIPSDGEQIVVDPLTSTIERHPVLPLPAVWMETSTDHVQ
ncbi:MAG TPA: hypothetical protein VJT72_03750 [Pseudonocardiaceae bacterium]|nr:hypothetical protein [Pseudonocardiaceae bacterium]